MSGGPGSARTKRRLPQQQAPAADHHARLTRENLALLIPLLLIAKCYGVAKFSLTTSGALISTAPVTVLLGTLALYAYVALPLGFLAVVSWLHDARSDGKAAGGSRLVAWALAVVLALLSPWAYLWPLAVVAVLYRILLQRTPGHWRLLRGVSAAPMASFAAVVLSGFVLYTIEKPWVPAEVLVLDRAAMTGEHADGVRDDFDEAPIAHVLSDDGDWVIALHAEKRYLMHIPSGEVQERIICHLDGEQLQGRRPLLYVLQDIHYNSPNTLCSTERQRGLERASTALSEPQAPRQ